MVFNILFEDVAFKITALKAHLLFIQVHLFLYKYSFFCLTNIKKFKMSYDGRRFSHFSQFPVTEEYLLVTKVLIVDENIFF